MAEQYDPAGPAGNLSGTARRRARSVRYSAWNLLLIVPLFMLITGWFNTERPRLFGWPFFYWYQMAFVVVGVVCVAVVYVATRHSGPPPGVEDGRDDRTGPPTPADLGDRRELR